MLITPEQGSIFGIQHSALQAIMPKMVGHIGQLVCWTGFKDLRRKTAAKLTLVHFIHFILILYIVFNIKILIFIPSVDLNCKKISTKAVAVYLLKLLTEKMVSCDINVF